MLVAVEQLQGISLGQVGQGARAQSHLGSKIAASRLCKRKLSPPFLPIRRANAPISQPHYNIANSGKVQRRGAVYVQCACGAEQEELSNCSSSTGQPGAFKRGLGKVGLGGGSSQRNHNEDITAQGAKPIHDTLFNKSTCSC